MSDPIDIINNVTSLPGRQRTPVAAGGGGPHYPDTMEARVTALETDMKEVRAALGRIEPVIVRMDERSLHLATKVELAEGVGKLREALAQKATTLTVWSVGITLAGLVVAALAAGAIYMPYLASLLRR